MKIIRQGYYCHEESSFVVDGFLYVWIGAKFERIELPRL
jgi:hypothetical protein